MSLSIFSKLLRISIFLVLLTALGCDTEPVEESDNDHYDPVGTWEFQSMTCEGTPLTLNDYQEVVYISPTGFIAQTTGNGCTISQNDGTYSIAGLNMNLGGGSYSCNPTACNFGYSVTGPGGTVDTETLSCPDELGSPPQPADNPSYVFSSATSFTQTFSDSGTTCKATYDRTATTYDPPTPQGSPPYTYLIMSSESGDYVGAGQNYSYSSADSYVPRVWSSQNTAWIDFDEASGSDPDRWDLKFQATNDDPLTPGTYSSATRHPFNSSSENGISISGNGRGCNTILGAFTILEIEYAAGGEVSRLAVNFEQSCSPSTKKFRGYLRFNSNIP